MEFCTEENLSKIDAYIACHKDEIVSDLEALVRIPSVSTEKTAEDEPFGKECKRVLEKSASLLENMGFDARVNYKGGYLVSEYGKGKKTLGIFTHADVVPAEGKWLICNPFEPKTVDGCIVGQ